MLKVFVYGTLKPGEINYRKYCLGKVISEIKAYTWGKLYNLPLGYPGMTVGKNRVEGYVLIFDDLEILKQLDHLEDFQPMRSPEENEYQRELIIAYNLSDESLGEVWGYRMTQSKIEDLGGVLIPSGCWLGFNSSQNSDFSYNRQ